MNIKSYNICQAESVGAPWNTPPLNAAFTYAPNMFRRLKFNLSTLWFSNTLFFRSFTLTGSCRSSERYSPLELKNFQESAHLSRSRSIFSKISKILEPVSACCYFSDF